MLILGIRAHLLEWSVNKITHPYLLELLTFAASSCKIYKLSLIYPVFNIVRSLLQIGQFVPVPKGHLSRFGTGIRLPGQKPWVVEPGQNVPHAKIFLRPAGFEPKTYCLVHAFLANSPK